MSSMWEFSPPEPKALSHTVLPILLPSGVVAGSSAAACWGVALPWQAGWGACPCQNCNKWS